MSQISEPVARYFPLSSGHYAIKPGFYRLGHDFGNGASDARLFQLDHQFDDYRQAKLAARAENPDKYICFTDEGRALEAELSRFLIERLASEYPQYFQYHQEPDRHYLNCLPSGETLSFTPGGQYLDCQSQPASTASHYLGGLDALAMQLQEDLALICLDHETDRLCAIHLCQPNHWDPREKIGRDFIGVHAPVPGMERINARQRQLLQACLQQGPFVRFAWGVSTDTRLNHHPLAPPGVDAGSWSGRRFDTAVPAAWLRVERQTLQGLPTINGLLFGIRTYHYALSELASHQQQLLYQAIETMPPASLSYKGLEDDRQALLNWLKHLAQAS